MNYVSLCAAELALVSVQNQLYRQAGSEARLVSSTIAAPIFSMSESRLWRCSLLAMDTLISKRILPVWRFGLVWFSLAAMRTRNKLSDAVT